MLDLDAPTRTVLGVELAADTDDPLLFHAFPAAPHAGDDGAGPDLQLLRFVRDGALTGGHLRLGIDLGHPAGRLDEVAAALAADPALAARIDPARPGVRVSPARVLGGSAELLFIGQETDDQGGLTPLLARPYGAATLLVSAPHRGGFAVDLTADGARLVETALLGGQAPLAVVARVELEGLWPAHRVLARVDWGRVYDHVSAALKRGWLLGVDDLATLVEELREDRAIVIEAVQSLLPEQGGGTSDLAAALAWVQRELAERFCEPVLPLSRTPARAGLGTLGEIAGVGTQFTAKRLTAVERATATVDFQQAVVLRRRYTVQAHLADLLGAADPASHLVDAGLDHPFFQRFVLRTRAAAPLTDSHLEEVVGDWAYGTAHQPLRLTADHPEEALDSWADAAPDRRWSLQATARFATDAPVAAGRSVLLPPLDGDGRELTLDLDQLLGLRRVSLSQPPDDRVLFSRATLRHLRGAEERGRQELSFTRDAATATAWFVGVEPGDRLEAAVQHLLADGRLLGAGPFPVDSTVLPLPPAVPTAQTVQLIASDDWAADGVQRVAVALQREPDGPTLTLVLDRPGATAVASLPLPDPVARGYRYRTTRMLAGGEVAEDDWVGTDRPVLLIGGAGGQRLVVDLTPVGPELPTAGVLLIEVEVSYLDVPNRVRDQRRFVIRALADRPRWELPIADPARRDYEYRITVHRTSGEVSVGPWTRSADRLLPVPVTRT